MRVRKDCRIAVGGAVGHGDGNAWPDSLTVHDDVVLGYGPSEAAVWAEEPYKLFHSCRNQTEIVSELSLELLVLGQVVADSAEQQGRCHHADDQALANASTVIILSAE